MDNGVNGYDNPALDTKDERPNTNGGHPTKSPTDHNGPSNGSASVVATETTADDLRCGFGSCKPSWLQVFNRPPWMLAWLCWFGFVQGFVLNGVNNVNTSSVERRFGLSSSEVSLISSAYDISAGIFVLPFSFMGATAHQPRMIAASAVMMSIGCFIMIIPHYVTDNYELIDTLSGSCDAYGNGTVCGEESSLRGYLGVFMFGQFINGMGGAILYTIGIVILDDAVPVTQVPMYHGIWYTFATLGPAAGYLLGGVFLDFYVDFDSLSADEITLEPSDPRWVGAWWLGFLISACLFLTSFAAFAPYPRELPQAAEVRKTRVSQAHNLENQKAYSDKNFGTTWKDFPKALLLLLKNPVNMLIIGAGVCEGMTTSGFATFLTKMVQNQFALTPANASLISGGVAVTGSAIGMFVGGFVSKIAKFEIRGNLLFNLGTSVVSMLFCFSLLAKCPSPKVAGVFVPYDGTPDMTTLNLTSGCNIDCHCTQQSYEPICGPEGVNYFSPCHAGCPASGVAKVDGITEYSNCSCILAQSTNWTSPPVAKFGFCESGCNNLYVFCVTIFVVVTTTFMQSVPGINISLRCVPESQRSFGMGVRWVFMRFLGTVLGPVLYGLIFDAACIVWQESCGERGSCWIYDGDSLAWNMIALSMVVKFVGGVTYLSAYFVYKPPKSSNIIELNNAEPQGIENPALEADNGRL